MATSNVVCAVAELWRFPVKSMRGERIEQAEFTERGLVGDRAHALIDAETGKVVSSESVRLFPDLLGCRAAFVEPPQSNRELPPVRIALPDGTAVMSAEMKNPTMRGVAEGVLVDQGRSILMEIGYIGDPTRRF